MFDRFCSRFDDHIRNIHLSNGGGDGNGKMTVTANCQVDSDNL